MKIILLSDVKNVGKKGEVKEVADGYGRNYLIRNRLAVEATKKSMEILDQQKADEKARQEELKKQAEELKKQIEAGTLIFKVRAGNEGKIFGSVSAAQVVDALAAAGVEVDKKAVSVPEIKEAGEFEAAVKCYKNVVGNVKLNVIAE